MERVKAISEIVENFVVATGIVIAGIWGVYRFGWLERPTLKPHLDTQHCVTARPLSKEAYLVNHYVKIKNHGKVPISPDEVVFMLLRGSPPNPSLDAMTAIQVPDPGEPDFHAMVIQTNRKETPKPRKLRTLMPEEAISILQGYIMSFDPRALYAFGISIREQGTGGEWFGGPTLQLSEVLGLDCSETRHTLE